MRCSAQLTGLLLSLCLCGILYPSLADDSDTRYFSVTAMTITLPDYIMYKDYADVTRVFHHNINLNKWIGRRRSFVDATRLTDLIFDDHASVEKFPSRIIKDKGETMFGRKTPVLYSAIADDRQTKESKYCYDGTTIGIQLGDVTQSNVSVRVNYKNVEVVRWTTNVMWNLVEVFPAHTQNKNSFSVSHPINRGCLYGTTLISPEGLDGKYMLWLQVNESTAEDYSKQEINKRPVAESSRPSKPQLSPTLNRPKTHLDKND